MSSGFEKPTSIPKESSSFSSNNASNGDVGNFECNICFDLAQDPIVTLCGHLFCWPCLYKWLHIHSQCQECPVCKALIEEQKLVPLYGRGKSSSDPRSKTIPGVEIPHRPAGQRPETAPPPPPDTTQFPQGFGLFGLGGFAPVATTRVGSFGFGGLVPSLNVHVHGFPGASMFGGMGGVSYGYSSPFHGGHVHGFPLRRARQDEQADYSLKLLMMVVIFFVLIALLLS